MKSLAEIKSILSQYKPIIQEKYQVSELGIFGSYVRGEQNEQSNVTNTSTLLCSFCSPRT